MEQKLRRLGKTYRDGLIDDDEYELQQRMLKTQLDSLVVPEERATLQAGHLLENLPLLWEKASLEERHSILEGFLECVYVDLRRPGTVVGIKPKPQFMGLFQFMEARTETSAPLENESPEPDDDSELNLTGWWRRGSLDHADNHAPNNWLSDRREHFDLHDTEPWKIAETWGAMPAVSNHPPYSWVRRGRFSKPLESTRS